MSTTRDTAQPSAISNSTTFRDALIGTLYALVSLIRKLRHVRHNEHSWTLVRIFMGFAGAALVVLPLGMSNGYIFSIVGLFLFAAAILLPPANPEMNVDRKARELGALAVVDGGRFQSTSNVPVEVQLFVAAENISVLDSHSNAILVMPVSEITSVSTVILDGSWILRIAQLNSIAAFSYRGIFAERLVHLAESAVRSVMPPSVPAAPRARAARA